MNCPSLDYVYDMTWAEFLIRLFAYERMELKLWTKFREVAWTSLVGSHWDPKKLPKSPHDYMPLGSSKQEVSEVMKDRMREVRDEYLKRKNNG